MSVPVATPDPAGGEPGGLEGRLADLDAALRDLGSVLVAFSGGVDSAVLLAAALRALGPDRVAAGTADSPSLPRSELAAAARVARSLGARHLVAATSELDREGYVANRGDRCAFCKTELLEVLGPLAARHGYAAVATWTNADDVRAGFRPGIRAAAARGAVTPLRDAGLTKADVRVAARRFDLPVAAKPQAACLASRIAYGTPVTRERLARVERAESALRAALADAGLAVTDLRVRDLGADRARVEVDRAVAGRVPAAALAAVTAGGFASVEVDPRGFRSGAMNELLPDPQRWRDS